MKRAKRKPKLQERAIEIMPDGSVRTLTRKEEREWRKGIKTRIKPPRKDELTIRES